MPLQSSSFRISHTGQFQPNYGGTNASTTPVGVGSQLSFATGTAAYQADREYIAHLSVTSGTPVNLDMVSGGLLQPDGTAFSVLDIAEMHVVSYAASGVLTVGGGSNAVPNIGFKVMPMGENGTVAPLKPGFAVTASTGDIVQISASAGTIEFDIHITGRSA